MPIFPQIAEKTECGHLLSNIYESERLFTSENKTPVTTHTQCETPKPCFLICFQVRKFSIYYLSSLSQANDVSNFETFLLLKEI